jgi:hypothetical protein
VNWVGEFLKFEFHGSAGTGTRVQVRGYEYAGTSTRVQGTGRRVAGKQIRVQRVFSQKNVTGPSQTRTRVPAYTRAQI